MIRPVVLAALLSVGALPIGVAPFGAPGDASAADTGQAAAPGQPAASGSAAPGQSGHGAEPEQTPSGTGEVTPQPGAAQTPEPGAVAAPYADGITAEEVAELIRDAGYRAEVKVDSDNIPYVSSRASGLNYWINFYGCEGEPPRCWDMEFETSFETNAEEQAKAVQWAVDKIFGHTYSIEDSTYFAMPVRVAGGITAENVVDTVELWDTILGDFATYIGWR